MINVNLSISYVDLQLEQFELFQSNECLKSEDVFRPVLDVKCHRTRLCSGLNRIYADRDLLVYMFNRTRCQLGVEDRDFTMEDFIRSGRELGGNIATDKEIYLNALRPLVGEKALGVLTKAERSDEENKLAKQLIGAYIMVPCKKLVNHFFDVLPNDPKDFLRFPNNLQPTGGDTSQFYQFAALVKFCRSFSFNYRLRGPFLAGTSILASLSSGGPSAPARRLSPQLIGYRISLWPF